MDCQILYNACVKACGTQYILDKDKYEHNNSSINAFNCHFYVAVYKKHCLFPNLFIMHGK